MSVGSSDFGDGADLVGNIGNENADASQNSDTDTGALGAVNQGIADASKDAQAKADEVEKRLVKQLWQEYTGARDFDKSARQGYSTDRKYAAGMADPAWASDANLIGSYIDILTSFLYAQNPDVNCKPAEQVGETVNEDNSDFAETMELVISRLWKMARLKKPVRRQVRSTLSVGIGWFKAQMWSKKRPQPQLERQLHDAETQQQTLTALITQIRESNGDAEDKAVEQAKLSQLIGGLRAKIMLAKEFGLAADFVRAEDMQVSLDVSSVGDYIFADWLSEDLYIPKCNLRSRFPRLSDEDCKKAVTYYQKHTPLSAKGESVQAATGEEAADGTFSKTSPAQDTSGSKPVEFVKVVEFWDKRDSNIKTMCDGVERWCEPPYTPPQASTRFYPYFGLIFFDVDGHRHPQSLAWRLRKLQDEYSAARSNQRLTRERSIPGLIFNRAMIEVEDAMKLENSVIAEMVGVKLIDVNVPIQNVIMVKPLPTIDVRLWDTTAITRDMESLSGVQEALQQTVAQQPKTATEAQIQQTGFASRTSADRDLLEDMLQDLAQYCAETAIQEIDPPGAQRIAGPEAFWPAEMDVQDLLTMVDVNITAGTSGKPNAAADKANWATILPLLQKLMVQIRQVETTDPPLAECLENLLRETLHRLDDRLDIDDFIATTPAPPQPKAPPPPPSVSVSLKGTLPALDAAVIGANAAGLPPEAALENPNPAAGPPHIEKGAPDHPGAHVADGEIPLHPHMPQPLPAAQKTPASGGETQKPQA
jgi:hypothetical protein